MGNHPIMQAVEIQEVIATELKSEADLTNVFGLDLTKCLITPTKQVYLDANNKNSPEDLWTVLEESPDGEGYTLFYNADIKMFGLGMKSNNGQLINIGYHGSFLKTLYSM
jgi:hypothetical protein